MRKCIVNDTAVTQFCNGKCFHIGTNDGNLWVTKFGGGNPCHFRRNINADDTGNISSKIIREQYACAAGNVQYHLVGADFGCGQNQFDFWSSVTMWVSHSGAARSKNEIKVFLSIVYHQENRIGERILRLL